MNELTIILSIVTLVVLVGEFLYTKTQHDALRGRIDGEVVTRLTHNERDLQELKAIQKVTGELVARLTYAEGDLKEAKIKIESISEAKDLAQAKLEENVASLRERVAVLEHQAKHTEDILDIKHPRS